jgi:hypothetical protein
MYPVFSVLVTGLTFWISVKRLVSFLPDLPSCFRTRTILALGKRLNLTI